MVCPGKCGSEPKWVIIAIPISDKMETEDFPNIAVCGDCEISYSPKGPGSNGQDMPDLAKAAEQGLQLGEGIALTVMKIADFFKRGKKTDGGKQS